MIVFFSGNSLFWRLYIRLSKEIGNRLDDNCLSLFCRCRKRKGTDEAEKKKKLFHGGYVFCCVGSFFVASIYSSKWDFSLTKFS